MNRPGINRRTVIVGGAAVAVAAGAGVAVAAHERDRKPAAPPGGPHQPGVTTAAPPAAVLAAFDVTVTRAAALGALLRELSTRIAAAPPDAEVTVAVGASLFDGRFGLSAVRPRRLDAMPAFRDDALDPAQCHGDVLLQVGAQQAPRAVLDAVLPPGLAPRWSLDGTRAENGHTHRDLLGFREGGSNPDPADAALMEQLVWVPVTGDEPAWTAGGSYQVVRVVGVDLARWNAETLGVQQAVLGVRKSDGAPLGHEHEGDQVDFLLDHEGRTIPLDAHLRRAAPDAPANRILRRSCSYQRPADSGLAFVCFQQDLERGFAATQRRMSGQALDAYTATVGGGYFFVLPGRTADPGDHLGRTLLGAAP